MKKTLLIVFLLLISHLSFGQLTAFSLQVTASDETCAGNGTLFFSVSNTTAGASMIYNIYRLPDVTTPISVTAASSFTGLTAGTYRVVATQSLGAQSNSQQQDITIVNRINQLLYNLTYKNVLCGNDGKITVNVTQGNPVSYEIFSGPMIFPPQASNVFDNLTTGLYSVRVFDACGDGIVQDVTISRPSIPNIVFDGIGASDFTCNTIEVGIAIVSGTPDLQKIIAYPLTVECTVHPPSGPDIIVSQTVANGNLLFDNIVLQIPFYYDQFYTHDVKITDACGNVYRQNNNPIDIHLVLSVSEVLIGCVKKLKVDVGGAVMPFNVTFLSAPAGFNPVLYNSDHPGPFDETVLYSNPTTPYPQGTYTVKITDACGRTRTESYTTQEVPVDFAIYETWSGCRKKLVVELTSGQSFTVEFLSAPAGFNPVFFNAMHPGPFSNTAEYVHATVDYPEGTYVIKLTDECGRTATKSYTTAPVIISPFTALYLQGCEPGKGSVLLRINGSLGHVYIDAAPPGFGQTLPYDVSQYIHASDPKYFSMNSLPAGNYIFRLVDTCNRTQTGTITIEGLQIYSDQVTVTEHCSSFDVSLSCSSNATPNNFWLQKYDFQNNRWVHPVSGYYDGLPPSTFNALLLNNNMNNTNFNLLGRFRVVNTFEVFGNGTENNLKCERTIREFDYQNAPRIDNIYSYSCSNTSFDVIVSAAGTDPLQYMITTKDGLPFVVNNNNSPLFSGLQPGVYNFQIQDACGNILNRLYDISSPVSFVITANNLCNGHTGSLSVPNFPFLAYEWWKDNNTTPILSTSNVLTFPNFNLATDAGIYHVRITNPGNPTSCMNIVLDFNVSNQLNNPEAGTGSSVSLCGPQTNINLYNYLTGTYDTFGNWSEISTSGMLINHIWNASGITSGTYTFSYRVDGLCGNYDESIVQITVSPIPVTPVASGDGAVCEGDSLHLFASDVPGVTYQWTGPNGFTSTDQNPVLDSITILNQGTYTVTAIQNGCVSETSSVEVLIDKLPYFSMKDNCQDNMTLLSATLLDTEVNSDSVTYTWTYPDGTVQDGNPINVSGNVTGSYTLTITSANGCSVTNTYTLACTNCGIPRGVSANNDGLNDNFDLSCLSGITNVKIFNRYGVNVFEKDGYVDDWMGKDSKGNLLPAATYYYVVRFETGDVKTGWVYLNY